MVNVELRLKHTHIKEGTKMRTLSKFRKCDDCYHLFIVCESTLKYETKLLQNYNTSLDIMCPRCNSRSIAVITKINFLSNKQTQPICKVSSFPR